MNNYIINKDGTIFSKKTGEQLFGCFDKNGYRIVKLKGKIYKVHRLVAMTYLPNPENKPQVNHIDGDKTNNDVSNLEWVTAKENINHAHKNKLATNKHLKKRVIQLDLNDNVVAIYDSYREASISTGISEQNISQVCRNYKPSNRPAPRQTAGGYKWKRCND